MGLPFLRIAVAAAVTASLAAGCSSIWREHLPGRTEPAQQATVRIGSASPVEFRVEIARTAEQQRTGLSGRDQLSAGTGMLFQFDHRREQRVWMAGMKFALDIAWIADGKVVAIDTLNACAEADENACPRWTSPSPVDALLEVPARSLTTVGPGMPLAVEEEPS